MLILTQTEKLSAASRQPSETCATIGEQLPERRWQELVRHLGAEICAVGEPKAPPQSDAM
jgi:hypothetical protein